ncbi:hypothetical protein CRG98_046626 [Punica granatum]|uniref:Uncharacterized protein n=1 Tax=Punica granatum TaxID=22663 RepID=A0A2I0HMS3_PUNGR|nr:hypothetical protein CRG98_046626 [Punica granatum]
MRQGMRQTQVEAVGLSSMQSPVRISYAVRQSNSHSISHIRNGLELSGKSHSGKSFSSSSKVPPFPIYNIGGQRRQIRVESV